MQIIKQRRKDIDALKGIAIIAVILYHMGFLKSGYLGVDLFFVINGFLLIPKLLRSIEKDEFKYFDFIKRRITRLLPLVILACTVSFVAGFILMLPDDFENLSESIIASLFSSNNILLSITVDNYWNVVNDYKPLMHLWYLGILMEYYVLFPLIPMTIKKIHVSNAVKEKLIYLVMALLSTASLVMLFLPSISAGDKFYLLPCRFFELTLGGIAGIIKEKIKTKSDLKKYFSVCSFGLLLMTLLIGIFGFDIHSIGVATSIVGGQTASSDLLLPNTVLIVMVVLLGCICMITEIGFINNRKFLILIGKRSYCLFVWHQIVLAFCRYTISNKPTIGFIFVFFFITLALSELSYRFIENANINNKPMVISYASVALCICLLSGLVYMRAGVVRDVPELDIYKTTAHSGMNAEYCDRVYSYDKEFKNDKQGKRNILIVGNSFARDWGNILLESKYAEELNISYAPSFSDEIVKRAYNADELFVFMDKDNIPAEVWNIKSLNGRIWGIGTKKFGYNNGVIYTRRFSKKYYDSAVPYDPGYKELNDKWKIKWGEHYIDMMEPITNKDGLIRVFTSDHKFISQDCGHLTKAGAKYYSEILELEKYLFSI